MESPTFLTFRMRYEREVFTERQLAWITCFLSLLPSFFFSFFFAYDLDYSRLTILIESGLGQVDSFDGIATMVSLERQMICIHGFSALIDHAVIVVVYSSIQHIMIT